MSRSHARRTRTTSVALPTVPSARSLPASVSASAARQRRRAILVLAAVMIVAAADSGALGATAVPIRRSLGISNAQVGLLGTASALAAGVAVLPMGQLTDRVNRVRLLSYSIAVWSLAMVVTALAPSYLVLILARVLLGAATTTAGPTLASLVGDLFGPGERARIWSLLLSGQLVGLGIGSVVGGELAVLFSWRAGFGWLALPGALVALAVALGVPEPVRTQRPEGSADVRRLAGAVRHVLSIRTNVLIIVATFLGYTFLGGARTFAVELLRSRYAVPQAVASLILLAIGVGGLAGMVLAGRRADRLRRHGHGRSRIGLASFGYLAAAALFALGLLSSTAAITVPLFVLAAAALAMPDAPLNAVRLDIVEPWLWGRAEGVRSCLYTAAHAVAPVSFGMISGLVGASRSAVLAPANGAALATTFLIMLAPVFVAGLVLLGARHRHDADVMHASRRAVTRPREPPAARAGG